MTVRLTRLENGLSVITDEMPHLRSAALAVSVDAGSRREGINEHGVAHLLEHMAFKGTHKRTAADIAEEIEVVGGELNAATSVESTAYFARILSDDVALAVDILSDILQNAVIDEAELHKEQHVILQEIGASLDMPEDLVFDRFQEVAFPDQALGRPILGTPQSVTSFTPTKIHDYLTHCYRAGAMVVSAAGDINHDDFVALVSEKFSKLREGERLPNDPAQYVGGTWVENKPLQEAQIVLGFEGRGYNDDAFFTTQLLAAVLGGGMSSRLFQEVREKRGLCYSVYAFHWAYADTGLFGIHAATGEEDIAELMPVILEQLRQISLNLSDEEVQRAKAQMRAGLLMSLESPASRAGQLARHILLFDRYISPDEQITRMEAITASDIMATAYRIFTSGKPTLSAIGPVETLLSTEDVVSYLNMMQAAE